MTDLETLNRNFAIAGVIEFGLGAHGAPIATLTNRHRTATVAIQGAQLLTWTPAGQAPVVCWRRLHLDAALGRRIRVSKRGSNSYVVWNPWIEKSAKFGDMAADGYRRMLCLETVNAGTDSVTVPPGASFTLGTAYSVEAL